MSVVLNVVVGEVEESEGRPLFYEIFGAYSCPYLLLTLCAIVYLSIMMFLLHREVMSVSVRRIATLSRPGALLDRQSTLR